MSDAVLAGQVNYYRQRAGEYDVTAYGDLAAARARIAAVIARVHPAGEVLELACGTGLWTEAISAVADAVLAVDAAPEALTIARARVSAPNVEFEQADVLSWTTNRRFDLVFFAAWLSHVPRSRFDAFWQTLETLLADGGRVVFVDEHVDERGKEAYLSGDGELVERQLGDGSMHRIVKNFVDPGRLSDQLRALGWDAAIERDGPDWVVGEARPLR